NAAIFHRNKQGFNAAERVCTLDSLEIRLLLSDPRIQEISATNPDCCIHNGSEECPIQLRLAHG
ncbi:MAG: hypothetical protein QGH82_07530, partial [Candidatus Woesearchaeota archaeon]|nr:hypothetical protein [Candidatus Woesearchaeota archaeon]